MSGILVTQQDLDLGGASLALSVGDFVDPLELHALTSCTARLTEPEIQLIDSLVRQLESTLSGSEMSFQLARTNGQAAVLKHISATCSDACRLEISREELGMIALRGVLDGFKPRQADSVRSGGWEEVQAFLIEREMWLAIEGLIVRQGSHSLAPAGAFNQARHFRLNSSLLAARYVYRAADDVVIVAVSEQRERPQVLDEKSLIDDVPQAEAESLGGTQIDSSLARPNRPKIIGRISSIADCHLACERIELLTQAVEGDLKEPVSQLALAARQVLGFFSSLNGYLSWCRSAKRGECKDQVAQAVAGVFGSVTEGLEHFVSGETEEDLDALEVSTFTNAFVRLGAAEITDDVIQQFQQTLTGVDVTENAVGSGPLERSCIGCDISISDLHMAMEAISSDTEVSRDSSLQEASRISRLLSNYVEREKKNIVASIRRSLPQAVQTVTENLVEALHLTAASPKFSLMSWEGVQPFLDRLSTVPPTGQFEGGGLEQTLDALMNARVIRNWDASDLWVELTIEGGTTLGGYLLVNETKQEFRIINPLAEWGSDWLPVSQARTLKWWEIPSQNQQSI